MNEAAQNEIAEKSIHIGVDICKKDMEIIRDCLKGGSISIENMLKVAVDSYINLSWTENSNRPRLDLSGRIAKRTERYLARREALYTKPDKPVRKTDEKKKAFKGRMTGYERDLKVWGWERDQRLAKQVVV